MRNLIAPLILLMSLLLPTANAVSAETATSKEHWIEQLAVILPNIMCSENQYFAKCFKSNPSDCYDGAALAVKSCTQRYASEMPATIPPKEGELWGRKISECAYEAFKSGLKPAGDCKEAG
ncbi:MAG: hypothetical protein L7F77_07795 [Candidatus Magnetominusculus sp. LBB02]|nr:hypothetical protein [Candidatus Magnetominusculus sp. LBB02]